MKLFGRPIKTVSTRRKSKLPPVKLVRRPNWRTLGLWMVFVPVSGAIAVFWEPLTDPENLSQITQTLSSRSEPILEAIAPYVQNMKDNLASLAKTDPIQTESVVENSSSPAPKPKPARPTPATEDLSELSLEEIERELQRLSVPLSPTSKPRKAKSKSGPKTTPVSVPHPLLSDDLYNLNGISKPETANAEESATPYLTYPSLNSANSGDGTQFSSPAATPFSSSTPTNSSSLSPSPLNRSLLPGQNVDGSDTESRPQLGSGRMYPFSVNSSINPKAKSTSPLPSVRPRGYGLVREPE
ncbi:hypothetical protein [Roseofilum casamattae]|uniref:Uncharacterized protein n=1 Tax=Roseofilum casamattae BLCC-M143 TaxID=3022442 RepID=A0ABT7BZH6_9CYAN|nr:hypothetical protein [Roseofilum casamattae]MDJ1183831.1 hypothetical protein [Roseofilum casamattae BLCC-M143]